MLWNQYIMFELLGIDLITQTVTTLQFETREYDVLTKNLLDTQSDIIEPWHSHSLM